MEQHKLWDFFSKYAQKHIGEKKAIREYAELKEFFEKVWNLWAAAYYDSLCEAVLAKYNERQVRVAKRLGLM